MASGTLNQPLNKNLRDVNFALRLYESDNQFRYQRLSQNKTYRYNNLYDVVLIIGSWGSNPKAIIIAFNGSGNATAIDLITGQTSAEVTVSTTDGYATIKAGGYLNGSFISVRGFAYSEVTT